MLKLLKIFNYEYDFKINRITKMTPYLMWLCAASFYFFQFILRVSPCVLADDIMHSYDLSASQFAGLGSLALYSYASMQIPAGILTDIFKPKKMVLSSLLLCLIGTLLLANTSNIIFAYMSRIMVGAGSASGLICCGKVASSWFSKEKQPLIFGMTLTLGTIGALNGGPPLNKLSTVFGWESALNTLVFVGIIIGVFIIFFMKDAKEKSTAYIPKPIDFIQLFKSKNVILYMLSALGLYVSICVLADLWVVKYLVVKLDISRSDASSIGSLIYIGLCAGSLALSAISVKIPIRYILRISLIILLILLFIIINMSYISIISCGFILFFIGFFSGSEMLCFTAATQKERPELTATVIGIINCIVMSVGALFQHSVGYLLDMSWDGKMDEFGHRLYSIEMYNESFFPMLFIIAFSTIVSMFIKKRRH